MSDHALPNESRDTLPPLRIHHFLAWMAVVAVLMSIRKFIHGDFLSYWSISLLVANTSIHALVVTVFGFGFIWRSVGLPFFNEPGHGLLLLQCGYFV